MGEVFCKVCGYRGTAGQDECPECGAPLIKAQAPAAETPKVRTEVDIIRKPKEKRPRPVIRRAAAFLALCLVLQSAGLWGLGRLRDRGFLDSGANWSYLYNGDLVTPSGVWRLDDWVVDTTANAGPQRVLQSLAPLLSSQFTGQAERYYYDGETLRRTDWSWGELSGDGNVLFYARREGEDLVLSRREGRRGQVRELDRVPGDAVWGAVIAYDGSAAVYAVSRGSGEPALRQWSETEGVTELEYEADRFLFCLGRDGENKLQLGLGDDVVEGYIVEWGRSGEESVFSADDAFVADRDLTQVLVWNGDGTVVYENQEGERKTVEGFPGVRTIWALQAGEAQRYSDRLAGYFFADRLTDRVYQSGAGRLYYLSEDLTATELAPDLGAKDCLISADGRTIYCTDLDGGLYRLDRSSDGWSTRKLAEDWGTDGLTAAGDLSLIDGKDKVMKSVGRYAHTLLDTATGEMPAIEHRHIGWKGCLLNGGVCWYLDGEELQYWTRETGVMERELPPDDLRAEGPDPEEGWDFELVAVGDGSQALLVRQPKSANKNYVLYGSAADLSRTYWLLTADGDVERLEDLTLSED